MTKKLTIITCALFLTLGVRGAINFSASDVQYWVGTGSNRAVVVIAWDDYSTPTALAWGVRWNGTVSALDIIDSIQTYDSRFSNGSSATLSNVTYTDGGVTLSSENNYWCYTVNGTWATVGYSGYTMSDGDLMEVSGSCYFSMTSATAATDPNGTTPTDTTSTSTTIGNDDILFWVGHGTDSAIIVINWVDALDNSTTYAWGIAFDDDAGVVVAEALDTLATYDPRFYYHYSRYMGEIFELDMVRFVDDSGDTLATVTAGMSAYNCLKVDGLVVDPGDFEMEWIWPGSLIEISTDCYFSYNTIVPVSVPSTTPAPVEATIAASDILYWVGHGSNQTVLAVNWADTALAWGFRFDGSATVADMMDAIAAADPRFSYVGSTGYLSDILYIDTAAGMTDTLRGSSWWGSTNNGVMDAGMGQALTNGDFEKWADPAAGIVVDSTYWEGYGWGYTYVYPMAITPVSVPDTATVTPSDTTSAPVEATIAASDILYWVGHGSNQAVLAVNWADTALAWGYRFDGTATVADMMDAIAAADPRFSYVGSTGYLSDILYIDTAAGMTDTLRGSSWWGSTNNGVMDAGMGQALTNGDFEKWADPAAGVVVDSTYWEGYGWGYTYVYPMAITPVSVPDTATTPDDPVIPDHGPFCGPAGTEGSNAIAGNSDLFVAWATGITLQRGPDNIAVPNSPLATYGDDTMALGPVVMTDNLKVVSLGDGGMATLTFAQPITNGDGPDFAVFENGFDDYFLELAFVEVSSDGNRFVRFPATSLTQTETQATRLDPTFINNLAGKYRMGYGTPFDLEELRDSTGINIDSITHVRIIDVVGSIDPQYATYDAFGHIVNDPWPTAGYGSSGFDLDAVGVIHQLDPQQSIADALQVVSALWPNPTADVIHISLDRASEATLYDLTGRHVNTYTLAAGSNTLNLSDLNAGVYMLRVEGTACKIVKK